MAYQQEHANRIRRQLLPGSINERKKMGGLSFMYQERVLVRLEGASLIIRCPPEQTAYWLSQPGVSRYLMRGKPDLKGWLVISPESWQTDKQLADWLQIAQSAWATQ
jgi:hypothetical protein